MREIKFRGKVEYPQKYFGKNDIPNGEFIVGELHLNCSFPHIHTDKINKYPIDTNTIGQFTGLHDKNGKAIYEGDIVYSEFEDGSNGSSLVGWNKKQSCFGIMDEYAYRSKLDGFEYPEFQNHVMLAFMRDAKVFKVIGNIYDNPELLKQK